MVAIKRKNKLSMNQSAGDVFISVFSYLFFFLFALICAYPFYYIFINSISSNVLSDRGVIFLLPREIQFKNYVNALKIPGFQTAAVISVGRTVLGTLLTIGATAFLGFMFTRETMWRRKFWYRFVIVTMYFSAGIIPWYITMRNLGLTNNFLAYILPTVVSPFFIVLTKTFIESIPKELQEAAEIDGATILMLFSRIILPVSKPILSTVAIFSAVNQWNSFQDTLLLVTDSKLYTLQFTLWQYINQASSLKNLINASGSSAAFNLATTQTTLSVRMTVTIIVVAPILFVYPIFQRGFVKGIMIGAVKG